MKSFKFKAKDMQGKLLTGDVEATSDSVAAKLIRQKGYIVISITPKTEIPLLSSLMKVKNKVGFGDLVTFTSQLSTMVNSGLPLTESLIILRNQSKPAIEQIASGLLTDVEGGESLSKAMEKNSKFFGKTYIALIKSGEVGGVMEKVLEKLSENLERKQEFSGKVKSALIYPVIIVFGMIAVSLIMLIFVVPRLTDLYTQFDAELPFLTRVLIGLSTFLSQRWYIVFGLVFLAVTIFNSYKQTDQGRRTLDSLLLKIPLVGDLQRQIVLADTTRTMSLMVGSGVSILEALSISSEVVGNYVIASALEDSAKMVEKGFPVAFAFSKHSDAFPPLVAQMISVGEETGKMDEVLGKLSHVFERESDQKLKAVTSAIEPLILIVLGVGVAVLVVSIIMPIYNLTSTL